MIWVIILTVTLGKVIFGAIPKEDTDFVTWIGTHDG
jgi:hypothetical protein